MFALFVRRLALAGVLLLLILSGLSVFDAPPPMPLVSAANAAPRPQSPEATAFRKCGPEGTVDWDPNPQDPPPHCNRDGWNGHSYAQAPAAKEVRLKVPVDRPSRAKFPREISAGRAGLIDRLALVNHIVNAVIIPADDQSHYGIADLWVMNPKDGMGDCEDYALTKLSILEQAGFPIVQNAKVVGVGILIKGHHYAHVILAVRLPSHEVAYLDERFGELMTRRELVAHGYIFFDWRA